MTPSSPPLAEIAADVTRRVESLAPRGDVLSDAIWDRPEMRWEEFFAARSTADLAREWGFTVTEGLVGIPTAIMAEAGSGGPVIAFLGEYDALAGLSQQAGVPNPEPVQEDAPGHGCGHNLLGVGSLIAAKATADRLAEQGLPGRVRFYGCPAEEAGSGKAFLVSRGAFEGVDVAVSWHPNTKTMVHRMHNLAAVHVEYHVTGVASHAGGAPEQGRSALDAVELMNVAANYLREHIPSSSRVHYAITDAGGMSPNVVQAKASVFYVIRGTTGSIVRNIHERMDKIAQGAALMTETSVTSVVKGGVSELLHVTSLENAMQEVMDELGAVPFTEADLNAAQPFAPDAQPSLSAEVQPDPGFVQDTTTTDVGDVSWVVPTVQCAITTAARDTPGHSWKQVAQGRSEYARRGMRYAAATMAVTALRIATEPQQLEAAVQEHRGLLTERPYRSLLPDGAEPPLMPEDPSGSEQRERHGS